MAGCSVTVHNSIHRNLPDPLESVLRRGDSRRVFGADERMSGGRGRRQFRTARRILVGTANGTPASLRGKAAQFRAMALASHDPELIEELELLAWRYLERAAE